MGETGRSRRDSILWSAQESNRVEERWRDRVEGRDICTSDYMICSIIMSIKYMTTFLSLL